MMKMKLPISECANKYKTSLVYHTKDNQV